MDEVFRALADPSRRLLLDSLNARNGQRLRELCAGLSMARPSVSKHLAVLEAANLGVALVLGPGRRGRGPDDCDGAAGRCVRSKSSSAQAYDRMANTCRST
jgi:DNA-binding transcriptional ArsR family regulator